MKKLKIVIAGGKGFIGQAMAKRWGGDNEIIILSRGQESSNSNTYGLNYDLKSVSYIYWDGKALGEWIHQLEGADILINLAGKSVNCRYTEANKAEIMNSRINATTILGKAVKLCKHPPKLWINAASATIYPHATDTPRDESFTGFADDFSVQVCKAWEASFNKIELAATRKVILRIAIVLGKGGVMIPFKRLTRAGLGGRQGSGQQMFSWIHINDLCRMVEWFWQDDQQVGTFNVSAPNPITNEAFMKKLRSGLGMPLGLPAPEWLLPLGAAIIGTETELLLKSRWVIPTRLLQEGFVFDYDNIDMAFRELL